MTELEFEVNLITTITEKRLGLEVGSLNTKTKTEHLVIGRMIVCNILMEGGISPAKLGEHFYQHRTAYYHYAKNHKNYIQNPNIYPEYNELYAQVFEEYESRTASVMFQDKLKRLEVIEDIDSTIKSLKEQKQILTNLIN